MKNKILIIFTILSALGLSGTAAYYSIIGLSLMFSGVKIPVIIMGSFLELSKLTTAVFLHTQWKNISKLFKIYLTTAVIILSLITSLGVYGLLSKGFQDTNTQNVIIEKNISLLNNNLEKLTKEKTYLINEKTQLTNNISDLRIALTDNKTQYKDQKTGDIITVISSSNRKSLQSEIQNIESKNNEIEHKLIHLNHDIDIIQDSLLNISSTSLTNDKLLPLKQISNLFNLPLEKTINIFIIMITAVFDPLAIMLVIVSSFLLTYLAVKKTKPINIEGKIIETPEEIEIPKKEIPLPPLNTKEIEELEHKIKTGLLSTRKKKEYIEKVNRLKEEDDSIKNYW